MFTAALENHDRALVVLGGVQGFGALQQDCAAGLINLRAYETVICADSGQEVAGALGLTPQTIIGDFDSSLRPTGTKSAVIELPSEKDMTDSEAAVDLAYARGFRLIDVLGGFGGRLDHSLGNLGIMAKYLQLGARVRFSDGYNLAWMQAPGVHQVSRHRYPFFGLVAFGGDVTGLTLEGFKYSLEDFTLVEATTLGVSNEFLADPATVSFRSGLLIFIHSRDVSA